MEKLLTIAGTDPSGGAGIQADLKTFAAHKTYGMSVITSVVAQNTTGVKSIVDLSPEFIGEQLDAVFTDIYPDAIKIGMISNEQIIKVIAEKLIEYDAKNIVVDPVMVATSGGALIKSTAVKALIQQLLPLADVITPNMPEAAALSGIEVNNRYDMEKASKIIENYTKKSRKVKIVTGSKNAIEFKEAKETMETTDGTEAIDAADAKGAVLVKGGHLEDCADDVLNMNGKLYWIEGKK